MVSKKCSKLSVRKQTHGQKLCLSQKQTQNKTGVPKGLNESCRNKDLLYDQLGSPLLLTFHDSSANKITQYHIKSTLFHCQSGLLRGNEEIDKWLLNRVLWHLFKKQLAFAYGFGLFMG